MNNNIFGLIAAACSGVALILTLITIWAWIRQWSLRFAMVGYTGFTLVLAAGCFALSLTPILQTKIPGAAPYTTVYDRGANQAVIVVANSITPDQLELTLQQAALNLVSSGRFSATGSPLFHLRARTLLHPEPGVTFPLYLGELQQSLTQRNDPNQKIEIFADAFAQLDQVEAKS